MSRVRVHEVSSPISLFPFIGILLCTMGALLVVLVAVSRSARDTAQQQVRAAHPSASAVDEAVQKKIEYVKQYAGNLSSIRGEAERKLRDEHLRLSHVEDHIRRLQEKMHSLQLAAVELEGLEKEHYDDRDQAEREIVRLNQLIDDSRKTIASLQDEAEEEPASYALVPYEGPNGTFRRPIYIECVKDEIILQPEGVRITADDLRPPVGAGNPLAAALRAIRDHLVRLYPKEGQSRDTEPYALLLVRPDGFIMFETTRQAIVAGDFDLGFELVEKDWKLKYPQPDPQLAGIEQQALQQARMRQEVLAAAAPRAYRNAAMSPAEQFGSDDINGMGIHDGGGAYGDGGSGAGSRGGGTIGSGAGGGNYGAGVSGGGPASGGTGQGDNSQAGGSQGSNGGGGPSGAGNDAYNGNPSGGGRSGGGSPAAGGGGSMAGGSSMPMPASTDPNAPPDAPGGQQNASMMFGSPPPDDSPSSLPSSDSERGEDGANPAATRGKDWALRHKPQRSVPIRRTIRVVVREDQLAILPDDAPNSPGAAAAKVVPMQGDTVLSLDEFVKHVREQIDGWGIAGNGLYWRPVILLNVGPEGRRRASDLARLLKNSGLELRTDETANNAPQGKSNETR